LITNAWDVVTRPPSNHHLLILDVARRAGSLHTTDDVHLALHAPLKHITTLDTHESHCETSKSTFRATPMDLLSTTMTPMCHPKSSGILACEWQSSWPSLPHHVIAIDVDIPVSGVCLFFSLSFWISYSLSQALTYSHKLMSTYPASTGGLVVDTIPGRC
jgi:hypothetical protein